MKKILIFHNIPAPYRLPLFRKLSEFYDLTVVFLQKKEKGRLWKIKDEDLNFPHVFLPEVSFSLFNKNLTVNHGISILIKNLSPDVVIAIDNPPNLLTTLQALRVCKKRKIHFLLWTGIFPGYTLGNNLFFKIGDTIINWIRIKNLYPTVQRFITYGKECRYHLQNSYKVNGDRIFVGTQGYPYEDLIGRQFKYALKPRKIAYKGNTIVYLGYLRGKKGIGLLLESAYILKKNSIDFNLLIIGDGHEDVKRLIEEYSKKIKITFVGYKEGTEKYNYLKNAKILILPTFKDAWGWVINEAMYMGIPVITTDKAMAKEMVVDGKNGYAVKAGELQSFHSAIQKILSMPEKEYLEFCKQAFATASNYGIDYSVSCFREALESIG
ncbi:hypothetical protein LCGC14_1068780 [marine sediment metagenome]|uniref:Glycosyl transferase family 1 domain-containing protein n=1 Tax=marine sediment metagenome TaxID=412755 RepID=A0A0F9Q227_9ZZZZ